MLLSDALIGTGGYPLPLMLTVYGLLAFPVCLKTVLHRYLSLDAAPLGVLRSVGGLLACSLACSLLFFVGTNWMVWMTGSWYEPTWAGLARCLTQALPFFRYTLAGDAVFAGIFFGGYAVVRYLWHERAASRPAGHRERFLVTVPCDHWGDFVQPLAPPATKRTGNFSTGRRLLLNVGLQHQFDGLPPGHTDPDTVRFRFGVHPTILASNRSSGSQSGLAGVPLAMAIA